MNESIYTMTIHPLVKPLQININSIFEMKKKRDLDGIFCDPFLVLSLISGLGVKLGRQVSGAIFKASGGGVADVVGCPGDWRVYSI